MDNFCSNNYLGFSNNTQIILCYTTKFVLYIMRYYLLFQELRQLVCRRQVTILVELGTIIQSLFHWFRGANKTDLYPYRQHSTSSAEREKSSAHNNILITNNFYCNCHGASTKMQFEHMPSPYTPHLMFRKGRYPFPKSFFIYVLRMYNKNYTLKDALCELCGTVMQETLKNLNHFPYNCFV